MATTVAEPPQRGDLDLELRADQQELLAEVVPAFAAALQDPTARARYAELERAIADNAVPSELVPSLEALLELLLETSRVRRERGFAAERSLLELYGRTPGGQALKRSVAETNVGLRALSGQVIESIAVSAAPGSHGLTITTSGCQVTVAIDRAGVRVERLDVGS